MKKEIINLTPHTVTLLLESGEHINFPPSKEYQVPRVDQTMDDVGVLNGIFPVVKPRVLGISWLPAPQRGVVYIVSSFTAQVAKRKDFISPDTTPDGVIRNDKGEIVAVRRFQKFY